MNELFLQELEMEGDEEKLQVRPSPLELFIHSEDLKVIRDLLSQIEVKPIYNEDGDVEKYEINFSNRKLTYREVELLYNFVKSSRQFYSTLILSTKDALQPHLFDIILDEVQGWIQYFRPEHGNYDIVIEDMNEIVLPKIASLLRFLSSSLSVEGELMKKAFTSIQAKFVQYDVGEAGGRSWKDKILGRR